MVAPIYHSSTPRALRTDQGSSWDCYMALSRVLEDNRELVENLLCRGEEEEGKGQEKVRLAGARHCGRLEDRAAVGSLWP